MKIKTSAAKKNRNNVYQLLCECERSGIVAQLVNGYVEVSRPIGTASQLIDELDARADEVTAFLKTQQLTALHSAKQALLGEFSGSDDFPFEDLFLDLMNPHPLCQLAITHLNGTKK